MKRRRSVSYDTETAKKAARPRVRHIMRKESPNRQYVTLSAGFDFFNRELFEGKLPQAIQEVQAALRLEEDNVQAYIKLASLQQSAKQFDDAIRSFEKAQQYAPQEMQLMLLVAGAYTHAAAESHDAAQAEKALQMYQRMLQRDERYAPAVHFGMGKVYLVALRQPETAVGHLEKAAEATTNVAEAHRLLIQAYYDIQRYEQAWQSLRRAQDLGFDFPDLLAALQKVKQQSQR